MNEQLLSVSGSKVRTPHFTTLFRNSVLRGSGSRSRGSAEGGGGPLADVGGTLGVPLQRLLHLALGQHQPHQLELLLGLGGGAVDGADQLQLLEVLEGLRVEERGGQDQGGRGGGGGRTFMMTGVSKL